MIAMIRITRRLRPGRSALLGVVATVGMTIAGCVVEEPARTTPRPDASVFRLRPNEAANLRDELLDMAARDEQIRSLDYDKMSPSDRAAAMALWEKTDREHAERLRRIVTVLGWPTRDAVGEEGVAAAFELLQHADSDPALQEACLPLLIAAGDRGEVPLPEVAYLSDRVRARQGRPQLYGTQYSVRVDEAGNTVKDANGRPIYLVPIVEDPGHLDERRRAMGLPTWAEQEAAMAEEQERAPAPAPRVAARAS